MSQKERLTNQKKLILEYLESTKEHPSAKMVYKNIKKKLPQISFGTVYRILNQLKKKGRIIEIRSKVSRYDDNISPHCHFICQKCQKIYDIFEKCEILKNKKIRVGKINSYKIYFYGCCKNCQKRFQKIIQKGRKKKLKNNI